MKHKKHRHQKKEHKKNSHDVSKIHEKEEKKTLEIVLKCDSFGSVEVVSPALTAIEYEDICVTVIHAGVGDISKSDIFMALTGSRLIIGFNVDVFPKLEYLLHEKKIEVRLYNVIYKLINDVQGIVSSMIPKEVEEKITGKAQVIKLFKSSRKGIILGCEILKGTLVLGKQFRIITAMGIVYQGKIESLHIQKDAVKEAKAGQQVGLKIRDFNQAHIGDLVECYETQKLKEKKSWRPEGRIFRIQ